MKYDVYGIGNALVDMEFEVGEDFLTEQGIEKGMMTLIDEANHDALFEILQTRFGLKKRAGGGSAANSMVALSQFGGKAFYACKVANDETGQFYQQDLRQAGVSTQLDQRKASGKTGKCMVMVTPDAERSMQTFLGITADFSVKDLYLSALKQAKYLYIEGYLVTSDVSRVAAIKARQIAKQHHIKTAFTFSDPAMVTYFRDGVAEILGDGVDILFCNEEEARTFTGKNHLNDAINVLKPLAKKLIITRGSQGAVIVSATQQIAIKAGKVETVVDTNGAGDMFAGTFMYGITHGLSDEKSANLATQAATKLITIFGARLTTQQQQDLLYNKPLYTTKF